MWSDEARLAARAARGARGSGGSFKIGGAMPSGPAAHQSGVANATDLTAAHYNVVQQLLAKRGLGPQAKAIMDKLSANKQWGGGGYRSLRAQPTKITSFKVVNKGK